MLKTKEQFSDVELAIRVCLNTARKDVQLKDEPWMKGYISGLSRALDFVIHAEIDRKQQMNAN